MARFHNWRVPRGQSVFHSDLPVVDVRRAFLTMDKSTNTSYLQQQQQQEPHQLPEHNQAELTTTPAPASTTTTPAPPAHLDVGYMQKALSIAFNNEKLSVESFEIKGLNLRGENFCSDIYRVSVSFRKFEQSPLEQDTFILKDLKPEVAALGSNEVHMFAKVLPAMAKILKQASPPLQDIKLSANCLFTERGVNKEIYLMEDLNALGYDLSDRITGLNYSDAQVFVRKIALFHAASMVVIQEQPELLEGLSPSHYIDGVEDEFAQIIVLDGTAHAASVVETWPDMAHIAPKMRRQLPKEYSARMRQVVDPQRSAFNVIVHGDLWVNNMMVNEQKDSTIFVDFQNCFVGSPAIDLHFFFATSLQLDALLHHTDDLLQHYFDHLVQVLRACHYAPLPTRDMLQAEMERCLVYAYYGVVCELPICCATKQDVQDFTMYTFQDKEAMKEKRRQLFENERVVKTLQAMLGQFEAHGILDEIQ